MPSHKNLKTSEDSRCLQIMPRHRQPRCQASINVNFKYLGVFRFFQTVESAEGLEGLCRSKFGLQMQSMIQSANASFSGAYPIPLFPPHPSSQIIIIVMPCIVPCSPAASTMDSFNCDLGDYTPHTPHGQENVLLTPGAFLNTSVPHVNHHNFSFPPMLTNFARVCSIQVFFTCNAYL